MSGFDDYLASAQKAPAAPSSAGTPTFDQYLASAGKPDQLAQQSQATGAGISPAARMAALAGMKIPELQQAAIGAQEAQSSIDSHLAPDSWIRRGADAVLGNTADAVAALDHHIGNLPLSVAQMVAHGASALGDAISPAQQNLSGLITGKAPQRVGAAGVFDNASHGLDNYIARREQTYQAGIPTDVGSVLGATAGEVAPLFAGGEASAGAKIANVADRATSFAQRAPILQKILSGAAQGAAYGALAPATSPEGSFASQKLEQARTGALWGGAIPAVGTVASEAYNTIRPIVNPKSAVRDYLGNLLGDQAASVAARLRGAPTYVPGSIPTAAQAGGSVPLVQAEKALANQSPDFKAALMERDIANNAARWDPLTQLAGSPADVQAARDARTAAIDPFVSEYLPKNGHLAANRWQGAQDAFQGVLDNPSRMPTSDFDAVSSAQKIVQQVRSGAMQEDDGLAALKELGDSASTQKAQNAFQAAQDAINKNMVDPSGVQRVLATVRNGPLGVNPDRGAKLDALMSGISNATNINGLVHTTMLDAVRQEASKILGNADAQGALAYAPARNALVQAIDRVAPGYSDYLGNYASHSQPLTDMGAASEMVDRLGSGARNSAGSPTLTLPGLNSQLRQLDNLRYPVSPAMRNTLTGIQQDLQRASISNSIRPPGSDTAYNLNTPGWLASKVYGKQVGQSGPLADMVRKLPLGIGPFLTSIKDTGANRVLSAAQDVMLNPSEMAKELDRIAAKNPRLARLLGRSVQRGMVTAAPQLTNQGTHP